jgi:putative peptidoglycan lipid II flippase
MILNRTISLLLIGPLRHGGLALANSLATVIETVILLIIIRGRMGGLESGALLRSAGRTAVATAVMGVALLWFTAWTQTSHIAWRAGGAVLFGAAVFLAVSLVTHSAELRALRLALRR